MLCNTEKSNKDFESLRHLLDSQSTGIFQAACQMNVLLNINKLIVMHMYNCIQQNQELIEHFIPKQSDILTEKTIVSLHMLLRHFLILILSKFWEQHCQSLSFYYDFFSIKSHRKCLEFNTQDFRNLFSFIMIRPLTF